MVFSGALDGVKLKLDIVTDALGDSIYVGRFVAAASADGINYVRWRRAILNHSSSQPLLDLTAVSIIPITSASSCSDDF